MRSVKSLHQTKKKHTGFDLFEAKDEIFFKRRTRDYDNLMCVKNSPFSKDKKEGGRGGQTQVHKEGISDGCEGIDEEIYSHSFLTGV